MLHGDATKPLVHNKLPAS